MKRRYIIAACVVLGLPILSVLFVAAATSTAWGEAWVRDFVARAVSDAIPGAVTVESLNDISLMPPGRISADVWNVVFTTDEKPVIQVEHARITYSWIALLGGEILIDEASVNGGTVTVELTPDGGVYLGETFHDGSAAKTTGAPMTIALRRMRARDMNVLVRLPEQLIHVEDVVGTVDVLRVPNSSAIAVELSEVSGVVSKPNILGSKLKLANTSGTIAGAGPAVVELDVEGGFMKADIRGSFRYVPTADPPVEISIDPQGAAARLVANLADFKTMFGDQVSIEVRE